MNRRAVRPMGQEVTPMNKKTARKMVDDAMREFSTASPKRFGEMLRAFLMVPDHNGDDMRVATAIEEAVAHALRFGDPCVHCRGEGGKHTESCVVSYTARFRS